MAALNLTIAPTTNNTLAVLGVTPAEVILVGQDGKTQAFPIGEVAGLEKATAGAIIELDGNEGAYTIKAITAPAPAGKAASTAGRAPKGEFVGEVQKPNV